jgi:DMSO reductase family type II enzyme heme b subunit
VVTPPRETAASPAALARGGDVYRQAKCWECHGEEGRGDGPSAATLKDDAGNAVRATNLRKGWQLKGGREPRAIFMRVSTGLDGAPMPSYADALSGEERWALALYVRSLQTDEEPSVEIVLRAPRIAGELPDDPADTRWRGAPVLAVPLAGQAIARPRWQNPSVDAVSVRALHNGQAVAFLLAWDDPTKDVLHRPGPDPEPGGVSYPRLELDRARTEALRDAVRLQFPMARPSGPERPHFFLGGPGRPVALWHWRADADAAGGDAVVAERGEGWARPVALLPVPAQAVRGRGAWRDGRWQVVMTRSLVPVAEPRDVTFEVGRLLPFAVQAWDGGHGEKGLMMSLSSWSLVVLEAPTPRVAYVAPLLAALLVGLGEWGLVRRVRRPAAAAR